MVALNKMLIMAALDMVARHGHNTVIIEAGSAFPVDDLVEVVKQRDQVVQVCIHKEHDAPYPCYAEPRRSKSDRKRDPKWRRK